MVSPRRYQQGISLYIIIVIVMLSMLLALWASRTALFNELIVGNDADYQRAFEAAQAVIQDAELDIRGERPDGSDCAPVVADALANPPVIAKPNICRVGSTVWFIDEEKDLGSLLATLEDQATRCLQGICQKRTGNQDFWNDSATLTAMIADGVAARYGQYTGAQTGPNSNPILNNTTAGQGAWYWVEIMPYDTNPGGLLAGKPKLELNLKPPVVFRVTAIARGLKASTQVVLQSTFARQKMKN
jgi:type IV pilus assembly protein PilX